MADEFAYEVYKTTGTFPKEEMFGIVSQLRRAAVSIPTNIVEGYSRKGDKELTRFVNIAIGSLAEVEYLLSFSFKLGYLDESSYQNLESIRSQLGKLLWRFYKKISG